MHITEGVLSTPLLISGAAFALAGTAIGLSKLKQEDIVKTSLLTAVFFLASLIHVPLGPASAHLVLNGLLGVILGWACFPAILMGLFLHAVLFQYGGLTSLGVNTMIMAGPALICSLIFTRFATTTKPRRALWAFACGALGILLGALFLGGFLALNGEHFFGAALVAVIGHGPVMVIEGLVTMAVVLFLSKVKPEILWNT